MWKSLWKTQARDARSAQVTALIDFIEASRIRFCGKYGPQAMASQAELPVGRIKCGWPERAVSEPMITTARRRKPAWASCPKMRTEPKARILEAFSRFAETSRRDTGSAIGAPEQTSPPDHPFRPAGAPELLCGGAVPWCINTGKSLIPLTLLFLHQKRNLLIPLELSRVMHQGRFPPGSVASRCWMAFSLRVRGTRIADIASDTPQIWGSPRSDDDRNGPARQS